MASDEGSGGAIAIVLIIVVIVIGLLIMWRNKRISAQRAAAKKAAREKAEEEEKNKPYDVHADRNAEYMFQTGGRIKCRNPDCFRMRMDYAWTCYGGEPPTHCSFCHHPFDLDKLKKELFGKDYSKKPEKVVLTMDDVTFIDCPNPICDAKFPMELGITHCSKCGDDLKDWKKCPNPDCDEVYHRKREHQVLCRVCKFPLPRR